MKIKCDQIKKIINCDIDGRQGRLLSNPLGLLGHASCSAAGEGENPAQVRFIALVARQDKVRPQKKNTGLFGIFRCDSISQQLPLSVSQSVGG